MKTLQHLRFFIQVGTHIARQILVLFVVVIIVVVVVVDAVVVVTKIIVTAVGIIVLFILYTRLLHHLNTRRLGRL